MDRGGRESERSGLDAGFGEQLQIAVHDLAPHNAHQHAAIGQPCPPEQHFLVAVGVDPIQLKSDGSFQILGFDAPHGNLPHDDLRTGQQHGGAQMRRTQLRQKRAVFSAPLRGRTLAKALNRQASQHLHAGGADARDGDFQIRAGNLDARAGTEGDQLAQRGRQRVRMGIVSQIVETQAVREKTKIGGLSQFEHRLPL